jgi:hypothetical protein
VLAKVLDDLTETHEIESVEAVIVIVPPPSAAMLWFRIAHPHTAFALPRSTCSVSAVVPAVKV